MKDEIITRRIEKLGASFTVDSRNGDYWDSIQYGNWEPDTYRAFKAFLRKTDTYIDFGAFIGATLLFAQHFCARSFAIEADPLNYRQLLVNIQLNPQLAGAIRVNHGCLGASAGVAEMCSFSDFVSTSTSALDQGAERAARTWKVESYTMEGFFNSISVQAVNFVKMDIEGGEYFITNSISNLFRTQPDVTLFLALHPHLVARSGTGATQRLIKAPVVFLKRIVFACFMVKALRRAPVIYLPNGCQISLFYLLRPSSLRRPFEIIATTRLWPASIR